MTMRLTIPEKLEQELLRYLKEEFYRGTRRANFIGRPFQDSDLQFFAKGVSELSRLFTTERDKIDSGYLNRPALRAGYLLYFLPINFAKTHYVLKKMPAAFWKRPKLRVLDLGSGPGTASLALIEELAEKNPKAQLELTLVDQSENALKDAEHLLRFWWRQRFPDRAFKFKKIKSDLSRLRWEGSYDLILMSHCLNELRQGSALDRSEWLLEKIPGHLEADGVLLITEPALKRPTRELMALRDHMIASESFSVLAPCLHQSVCPMLKATSQDWCHFYGDWSEPEYLKVLDRIVKNDNRFLKVAYLILSPSEENPYSKPYPAEQFRVVSNRMATRGKTELVLCGVLGRIKLSRLSKDTSPENQDLDDCRRGDLISVTGLKLEGFEVEKSWRLKKPDQVKILERA